MKTTELIALLKHNDVTNEEGYNLIISDIWDFTLTPEQASSREAQLLISYFMYKIQAVLLPVVRDLRANIRGDADPSLN